MGVRGRHYLLVAALAWWASACGGDDRDHVAADENVAPLTEVSCADADKTLFFHGLSGYGRELARPGICVPRITDFSSSSFAYAKTQNATLVAGYSAGRLPLLKRLADHRAPEKRALLLDPSWADGRRFAGKTGPEIVAAWLEANAERRFVIVYSPSSAGWREYTALKDGPLADRVRACKVEGEHLDLPDIVGPELLLDTDAWLASRCR